MLNAIEERDQRAYITGSLLRVTLAERVEQLQKSRADIATLQAEIEVLAATNEVLAAGMNALESAREDRASEHADATKCANEKIARRENKIVELDTQLAAANAGIADRDRLIAALTSAIEQQAKRAGWLKGVTQERLAIRDEAINKVRQENASLRLKLVVAFAFMVVNAAVWFLAKHA